MSRRRLTEEIPLSRDVWDSHRLKDFGPHGIGTHVTVRDRLVPLGVEFQKRLRLKYLIPSLRSREPRFLTDDEYESLTANQAEEQKNIKFLRILEKKGNPKRVIELLYLSLLDSYMVEGEENHYHLARLIVERGHTEEEKEQIEDSLKDPFQVLKKLPDMTLSPDTALQFQKNLGVEGDGVSPMSSDIHGILHTWLRKHKSDPVESCYKLVQALLCTEGLGHLVSHLQFPTCMSNPPSVMGIISTLSRRKWKKLARYLGYTPDQVERMEKLDGTDPILPGKTLLQALRIPDFGEGTEQLMDAMLENAHIERDIRLQKKAFSKWLDKGTKVVVKQQNNFFIDGHSSSAGVLKKAQWEKLDTQSESDASESSFFQFLLGVLQKAPPEEGMEDSDGEEGTTGKPIPENETNLSTKSKDGLLLFSSTNFQLAQFLEKLNAIEKNKKGSLSESQEGIGILKERTQSSFSKIPVTESVQDFFICLQEEIDKAAHEFLNMFGALRESKLARERETLLEAQLSSLEARMEQQRHDYEVKLQKEAEKKSQEMQKLKEAEEGMVREAMERMRRERAADAEALCKQWSDMFLEALVTMASTSQQAMGGQVAGVSRRMRPHVSHSEASPSWTSSIHAEIQQERSPGDIKSHHASSPFRETKDPLVRGRWPPSKSKPLHSGSPGSASVGGIRPSTPHYPQGGHWTPVRDASTPHSAVHIPSHEEFKAKLLLCFFSPTMSQPQKQMLVFLSGDFGWCMERIERELDKFPGQRFLTDIRPRVKMIRNKMSIGWNRIVGPQSCRLVENKTEITKAEVEWSLEDCTRCPPYVALVIFPSEREADAKFQVYVDGLDQVYQCNFVVEKNVSFRQLPPQHQHLRRPDANQLTDDVAVLIARTHKWFDLGKELRVDLAVLVAISNMNIYRNEEGHLFCSRCMLSLWVTWPHLQATWGALILALHNLGLDDTAVQIERIIER